VHGICSEFYRGDDTVAHPIKEKERAKRIFLPKPPFPRAGVSQSAVEQLLVFLEWSWKKLGVGGVELFFELECSQTGSIYGKLRR
jgi:hypothetical protein